MFPQMNLNNMMAAAGSQFKGQEETENSDKEQKAHKQRESIKKIKLEELKFIQKPEKGQMA